MDTPAIESDATPVPPYYSDSARETRRHFSQYAVEEALVKVLAGLAGTLPLYAHRLPPETPGAGITMKQLTKPERDAFPVWRGEAEVTGISCDRDSFADRFSRMLAALPAAGITVTTPNGSTVVFREINLNTHSTGKETRLGGVTAITQTATLDFAVSIPATQFSVSDFSADEAKEREELRRQYAAVLPEVLTRTLAKYLNTFGLFGDRVILSGLMPEQRDGLYLELTSAQPFDEAGWRDFGFRLRGRDRDETLLRNGFLQLHGKLPLPAVKVAAPNGLQVRFFHIGGTRAAGFRRVEIFERYHLEAEMELSVRIDCAQSSWSSAELPPEETGVAPAFPADLLEFERAFTAWTAEQLGLKVDTAIWRGGIPLEQSGIGVHLKGFSFQKLAANRIVQLELIVRHRERNALLEQLSRFQQLFPIYDVELPVAGIPLPIRAILPVNSGFSFPREHGNQHHQVGFELKVVL